MTANARGSVVRRAAALSVLPVLVLALAACGNPVDKGPRPTLAGADTKVGTAPGFYGEVVVDGQGRTLYQFSGDRDGQSTCFGPCAETWKPYLATGDIQFVNPNVNSLEDSELKLVPRQGTDQQQVSYAGHPLYFFSGDQRPGDQLGTGKREFGGQWTATAPGGQAVFP